MARCGCFVHIASGLFLLCNSLRPELRPSLELNRALNAVSESLGDFQENAIDAGIEHVDGLVEASRDALKKVEQGKEFPAEAKAALERVIQIIKDTMFSTLDDLHTEDQELVDTIHEEVMECNSGMTKRLEGDIGQNQKDAERLRGEEADLAQRVKDLQTQNKSKHEQLAALMSNKQLPTLCNSFPSLPVEELWEEYYKQVEEYSATAAVEAKYLQDQRNERDSIVSSLVSTTEKHVSTFASLSVSFCDWKRNLGAACSTHDTCYTDKSARMQRQLEFFSGARDKRIAAYRSALQLIDDINKMMLDNPEPMTDDAETRFPTNDKEIPEKAECDLGVLDEWDASIYGCGDQADISMVLTSCGASGRAGPNQQACNSEYGKDTNIEVSAGYQLVTIQKTGVYSLSVSGARGGHHGGGRGGNGARVNRTVTLQASDQLFVVVGQMGWDNPTNGRDWGGGGGGGSFVAKKVASGGDLLTNINIRVELLAAAGGGAGLQDRRDSDQALGGRTVEGHPSSRAEGGLAGGGAGYQQDGSKNHHDGQVAAGSFLSSALGGEWSGRDRWGGFGGGGAPWNGGGGGGGYDGGDCTIGGTDHDCYGGSSYGGITAEADVNDGPGSVSFQSQF